MEKEEENRMFKTRRWGVVVGVMGLGKLILKKANFMKAQLIKK
jgi:hypothetical protein